MTDTESAAGPLSAPQARPRALLWGLVIVFCAGVIEVGSCAGWTVLEGELWSPGAPQALRKAIVDNWVPYELQRAERLQLTREEALHPYLGFVLSPEDREGVTELGFPGQVHGIPRRPPGGMVVAITGGSVANEFYHMGRAHLQERLAAADRFAGRQVVFFDAAIPGYKQPQQLFALAWLLVLGAELDVVINLDGFNEVALHEAENAWKGVFPAYPRTWALRVESLQDPYLLFVAGRAALCRGARRAWAKKLSHAPWRWSPTASLMWRAGDRWLFAEVQEAERMIREYTPAESDYRRTGPRLELDEGALYPELVRIWRESSEQMQRLAEGNGITYLHFLQPNQYVEGSKPLSEEERAIAYDLDHPYAPGAIAGYPLLIQAGAELAREGVAFTDLTGIFASQRETLYKDSCCHLNARGNEILAGAISEVILGRTAPAGAASTSKRSRTSRSE